MSDARKKVIAECAGDIRAAILALTAGAELMGHDSFTREDVFECGKACGYLGAARALVEVAERGLYRILDNQAPHPPTPTHN